MKKIQKNGNKRKSTRRGKNALGGKKPTQGKKNVRGGMNKRKAIQQYNGSKSQKKKIYRQVRILVRDSSQTVPATIYGEAHHPGNINPGFRVVVSDDPERELSEIGEEMAMIYSTTA